MPIGESRTNGIDASQSNVQPCEDRERGEKGGLREKRERTPIVWARSVPLRKDG